MITPDAIKAEVRDTHGVPGMPAVLRTVIASIQIQCVAQLGYPGRCGLVEEDYAKDNCARHIWYTLYGDLDKELCIIADYVYFNAGAQLDYGAFHDLISNLRNKISFTYQQKLCHQKNQQPATLETFSTRHTVPVKDQNLDQCSSPPIATTMTPSTGAAVTNEEAESSSSPASTTSINSEPEASEEKK